MSLQLRIFQCGCGLPYATNSEGKLTYDQYGHKKGTLLTSCCRDKTITEIFEKCRICKKKVEDDTFSSQICSELCNEKWENIPVQVSCRDVCGLSNKYCNCGVVFTVPKKRESDVKPCAECQTIYQQYKDAGNMCNCCGTLEYPTKRLNGYCMPCCNIKDKCMICKCPILEGTGTLLLFCGNPFCCYADTESSVRPRFYADSDANSDADSDANSDADSDANFTFGDF